MKKKTVMETRLLDLCVSCGICVAACPEKVISMEFARGQFLPNVSKGCTQCGLCLELCPGIDIRPDDLNLDDLSHFYSKNYINSYVAKANDLNVRMNAASGGMITSLILKLIQDDAYDYAFVLPFSAFDGHQAKVVPSKNLDEILRASKSKYIPVSVENVIEAIKKKDGSRLIVVATGCEIFGIKKFLKRFKYPEENILFLGLFCEKTLNFNIIRWFGDKYAVQGEKIKEFHFKSKEKKGWPGDVKIVFDSNRKIFVDSKMRMQLKDVFQLNRCLFCIDKLNYLSDIAFGDCYIKGEEDYGGRSSVIVRTQKGMGVMDGCSKLLSTRESRFEDILISQTLTEKKDNAEFIKIFSAKCGDSRIRLRDAVDMSYGSKLRKRMAKIKLGQTYDKFAIKTHLVGKKLRSNFFGARKKISRKMNNWLSLALFMAQSFAASIGSHREKAQPQRSGGNIIIVGGELFNKGAQAMTFTVVSEMKRRFSGQSIYLFSHQDYLRPEDEKEIYNFKIMPWSQELKRSILGLSFKESFLNAKKSNKRNELGNVLSRASFIIDISGYALSSQCGFWSSLSCLENIAIAKKFFIPYYILPQSMGPFNFGALHKLLLTPLLKQYLTYPQKIYAREKDGYEHIRKFSPLNLELRDDIVLCGEKIDPDNVYRKSPGLRFVDVTKESVGIIPNQRVVDRVDVSALLDVYEAWINKILQAGKKAYLLRHSYEDLKICSDIKERFLNNPEVILLPDDFSAIEMEHIIKQFDFVIASRYHAIVHAYKNGVPVIALGWAVKYKELLQQFSQDQYLLDCRQLSNEDAALSLDHMMLNVGNERMKILRIAHEKAVGNSVYF